MSIELSIGPRGINHERDFRRGNEFRLDLSTIHLREERFFGCTGMEGLKFMCAMPRGIYTVMTRRRGLHLMSVAIVCVCGVGWITIIKEFLNTKRADAVLKSMVCEVGSCDFGSR